jgi:hypothetical protein
MFLSHSVHLKHTGPDVESGLIVLGGAMLEEPIKEGVAPKMKGSVLMCVADTEEEVLERVRKDVYWTSDVWDKEKVSLLLHWKRIGGFGCWGWWGDGLGEGRALGDILQRDDC